MAVSQYWTLTFTKVKITWVSVCVGGWLFFLQTISHDWEDLRTSNLTQRWCLVRRWCAHLDFWKKIFNCCKIGILHMVASHVNRKSIYVAPPCEWILHTLPRTMRSTEDPVTLITLLVCWVGCETFLHTYCYLVSAATTWQQWQTSCCTKCCTKCFAASRV